MGYKRLNITLEEDVLAQADAFAKGERYSRSGLIAAALEAYVGGGVAREAPGAYGAGSLAVAPERRPVTLPPGVQPSERPAPPGEVARPDLSSVMWDVDLRQIDEDKHADFIIRRVLEAGRPEQLAWLFRRYGDDRITDALGRSRGLSTRVKCSWTELLRRRRERTA